MDDFNKYHKIFSKFISDALRNKTFAPLVLPLLNYKVVFTENMPIERPACVDYSKSTIYINPNDKMFDDTRISKDRDTREKILIPIFAIHEISHPLLSHDIRRNERDPSIWNSAGDFVINLLIKNLQQEAISRYRYDNGIEIGQPKFNTSIELIPQDSILLDDQFDGMLEEEVYDILKNDFDCESSDQFCTPEQFEESLNGEDIQLSDTGDPTTDIIVRSTTISSKEGDKEFKDQEIIFPESSNDGDRQEAEKTERRMKLASTNLKAELMAGTTSVSLKKFLGKLFSVKIDWKRILLDSIASATQVSPEVEWGMPTDEFLGNPFTLPYMPNYTIEDKCGVAVFLRDQSGSMTDHDVGVAGTVVWQAREHYDSLLMIDHDYDNVTVYYFEDSNNLSKSDLDIMMERHHCGGTSHKWALEEVDKFIKESQKEVAIIIGITDLCSDLQNSQDIVSLSIPRVWLVNSNYEVHGLIGRVIRMK